MFSSYFICIFVDSQIYWRSVHMGEMEGKTACITFTLEFWPRTGKSLFGRNRWGLSTCEVIHSHWVPCARGWSWTRFLGIYTLYYRDFRWKRCRGLLPYPQQKTPTLPTWQPTTHMASTARALEAGRNAFRRPWELQPHPSVVRGFWRPWCQPACFVGSSLCLGDVFSQTVTKIRKPTSMMDDPATKYG